MSAAFTSEMSHRESREAAFIDSATVIRNRGHPVQNRRYELYSHDFCTVPTCTTIHGAKIAELAEKLYFYFHSGQGPSPQSHCFDNYALQLCRKSVNLMEL
ncbi:hypothetical protein OESDEN_17991 [Oesophagostomum dentatum]|uniref:Uncharacterized protein n=1 Tax=Oesophagostomum dentatum TaxID=61180 RepID=A0A0B1SEJ5_OESDE|nr:hypothetical protein OESDEN_17991 [Oesophagostomum dentatum]